ncbi:peptidylprolyl isomerase [Candidatus Oleimmundimicrobium sp.]|uniref:FKBP-type peptidyl-prolyl cis-trans isomerase n=1 Tax=Candidatus Oleimmundimicrobium sp. TaxID=3060597 RepID=UPI0027173088|nr:peptidylprolyl isomerase [Candidatus Oleimmundimicrobium sp.]MDO8885481.1 peptidylprolyl isomerase [Candidatus Oleimmundimicrobium sp.]
MQVKKGDKVSVHYTGLFEDGQEFDSSKGRDPITFEVGSGQVVIGFEEAVLEMKEGEKKEVSFSLEKGYGEYKKELIKEFSRSVLGDYQTSVGQVVQLNTPEGQVVSATIKEITDDAVTFDFNHPLAGKTLCFKLELINIEK